MFSCLEFKFFVVLKVLIVVFYFGLVSCWVEKHFFLRSRNNGLLYCSNVFSKTHMYMPFYEWVFYDHLIVSFFELVAKSVCVILKSFYFGSLFNFMKTWNRESKEFNRLQTTISTETKFSFVRTINFNWNSSF